MAGNDAERHVDPLEATAYHEAGHALTAVLLGAIVRQVTVDPDRDDGPRRYGDVQVHWPVERMTDREFRECSVRVILAGPVAEMLYTGEHSHPAIVAEWADDWRNARAVAEPLHPDPRRLQVYLESVTLLLLSDFRREQRWAAVAALADELLAHETLEHDDIAAVAAQWPA